jgi:SRSO17 transposase
MVGAGRVKEKVDALVGRLGTYFARVEPLQQVGKYLCGLLSDLPRKNCWTLAEYAGDRTPDRMQRLLERASWDTFAVMGVVRDFVVEHLADEGGLTVLVLDESGAEKTGERTAGVKRQYVGCAGKVANAVNFVNATYSTASGHALVGSRLYVPAEQLTDGQTRIGMGIPPTCRSKPSPHWAWTCSPSSWPRTPTCRGAQATRSTAATATCANTASATASATCSACRARCRSPSTRAPSCASTPRSSC